MDAMNETKDVVMTDGDEQHYYNFFDAALPPQPYTPKTESFSEFQSHAGRLLQSGDQINEHFKKTSSKRYSKFKNMIHRAFPSEGDFYKFFEYIQILFPHFRKRYELNHVAGLNPWMVWYHENSKSVCFLSLYPDDVSHAPFKSITRQPVYRIRLKQAPATKNDTTDIEKQFIQEIIPTTLSSAGERKESGMPVAKECELVEYFENNTQISEGLPGDLVDVLFTKLYYTILKFIFSEKTANTMGKSGILNFFLQCLVNIPEKRRGEIIPTHREEEEDGNHVINSHLGYEFSLHGTPFTSYPILIIFEEMIRSSSEGTDGTHELLQSIRFRLTFDKENFPHELRLINVENYQNEASRSGGQVMKVREMSPNSINKNFFGERNQSTIMVNFLEYFLHQYLLEWGCVKRYDLVPQGYDYGNCGLFYHPLAMERIPWRLLEQYVALCVNIPILDFVQVNVLKDDLSPGDAVDMGGPSRTFVEQMARQIFRCQEKKMLLYSFSDISKFSFYSCISLYSPEILFPVFFHVKEENKMNVAFIIALFFRQTFFMEIKMPPLIHPLFFKYFLDSKRFFSPTSFPWKFLNDKEVRGMRFSSISEQRSITRNFGNFVHYYHHILIDLVVKLHENDGDSEKNPILYFALFLQNYFVPKMNPSSMSECFLMYLVNFVGDRPRHLKFYDDLQIVLDKYFTLQMWDYEAASDTAVTFPEEGEDFAESEDVEMKRFFYLKTKYNQNYTDKRRLSSPTKNEVVYLSRKLIQILKEAYDPILEFIFYFRKAYDSKEEIFHDDLVWDNGQFNANGKLESLASMLMGSASRETIADGIQLKENRNRRAAEVPPLVLSKIQWLKEHIVDPSTSQEWVDGFVTAVTGTSVFMENIEVEPVSFHSNQYCTAHTCFNQLDVCWRTNECPGIPVDSDLRRSMSEKAVFIKNLTDGLISAQHHSLLA